jgi:hypothetical protein
MDLSSKDAINNADTYALYANGMFLMPTSLQYLEWFY